MNLCEMLQSQMGGLFTCEPHGVYTRIRTPYLYPDGDILDLFLAEKNAQFVLSDLGETLRWLHLQTPSKRLTKKRKLLINEICQMYGIENGRGILKWRAENAYELSTAVTELSQAALRIADLVFTFRFQLFESLVEEVELFFVENNIAFEKNVKLIGRSGREWTLDFQTNVRRGTLISVLSTGSRPSARAMAERSVARWVDLSHYREKQAMRFVSLVDDQVDVWAEEDFNLLEPHSELIFWSKPHELLAKLTA